jgi:hypothetical protein
MNKPKYQIGQELYLVHLGLNKDEQYSRSCGISKYIVSGISQTTKTTSERLVGGKKAPIFTSVNNLLRLSNTSFINAVSDVDEEIVDLVYGFTIEEAKAKAHLLIDNATLFFES